MLEAYKMYGTFGGLASWSMEPFLVLDINVAQAHESVFE